MALATASSVALSASPRYVPTPRELRVSEAGWGAMPAGRGARGPVRVYPHRTRAGVVSCSRSLAALHR
jgi:hypothetical protein